MSYVVIWAISGLIGLLLIAPLLTSLSRSPYGGSSYGGGSSFGSVLIVYVIGMIIAMIAGALTGALYAFIYNAAARIIGGIEVEVR